jgi:hypothetical protein
MSLNTCRFCKKYDYDGDRMVKYGVRHYAHFHCYLEAGKSLTDLHDWQIVQFPFRLLVAHGVIATAESASVRISQNRDR